MGTEDEFDEVRKMINRMLSDAVQGKQGREAEPHVRGFTSRIDARADRLPLRRHAVPVPKDAPVLPGPEVEARDEIVYVTLDLGGQTPSAVYLKVSGRLLLVEVEGPFPLQRVVELPGDVEPNPYCAVRDGVLDITLRRRKKIAASP